jgi:sugar O-acyltransferase (sialic acid O-acetyltransferase NeuD family)
MPKKLIVIGSGGHAGVVIDIIETSTDYKIIGVTTKDDEIREFIGYPVLGNDDILFEFKNNGINKVAIGIGGYRNNALREKSYNFLKSHGLEPVKLIHKSAVISRSVSIGEGSVVFPGVVMNTHVKIGNNVIVATSSSIDHETIIEDHVLVSAGVTIGAYAKIGSGSLIALGVKIISGINVCSNALVGAGAVVVKDITEPGLYLGIPAKKI